LRKKESSSKNEMETRGAQLGKKRPDHHTLITVHVLGRGGESRQIKRVEKQMSLKPFASEKNGTRLGVPYLKILPKKEGEPDHLSKKSLGEVPDKMKKRGVNRPWKNGCTQGSVSEPKEGRKTCNLAGKTVRK